MDNSELLTQYFIQLEYYTKTEKITAQAIREAAAATTVDISGIIDPILSHAEAQGINPAQELVELYAAQSKAKDAATDRQRRADMKIRALAIGNQAAALAAEAETAAPDKLAEALAAIGKEAAGLTTTAATVNRFPSWTDYEATWQKDDCGFSPALFDRLDFPEGTVSYIGARTGRGKTTAMVNIGIEALFPPQGTTPRRVLFVSLEESHKQILRRFSLCLAYRDADTTTRAQLDTVRNPYSGKTDPKNAYKNWKRGRNIGNEYGQGYAAFVRAIIEADKKIRGKVESRELVFFDGIGASLAETLAAVRGSARGDIVLVDYIQKIPAAGTSYSGNPDLERIRKGSEGLIEAAMGAECVVIAGAQFNRDSAKGQRQADDEFTDADFRGCGDLEQDGHNLLGIGRSADKQAHYYGVIKSREGDVTDKLYTLDFAGGYSYMGRGEGEFTPKPPAKNGGRKKKTTKVYNDNGTYEEVEFTGGEML